MRRISQRGSLLRFETTDYHRNGRRNSCFILGGFVICFQEIPKTESFSISGLSIAKIPLIHEIKKGEMPFVIIEANQKVNLVVSI